MRFWRRMTRDETATERPDERQQESGTAVESEPAAGADRESDAGGEPRGAGPEMSRELPEPGGAASADSDVALATLPESGAPGAAAVTHEIAGGTPGDRGPSGRIPAEAEGATVAEAPVATPEAAAHVSSREATAPPATTPEATALPAPSPGATEPVLRSEARTPVAVPDAAVGNEASPRAPAETSSDEPRSEPPAGAPHTLADGVEPSRRGFMRRLRGIFGSGRVDESTWEAVEETLIAGDVGAVLAIEVVARAREGERAANPEEAVRAELAALLAASDGTWRPRRPSPTMPAVVLVVGVNGTGKTTSIAKLAGRLARGGDRVLLAAADTFRAAAIEQLTTWAGRLQLPVVAHKPGADPSAVVYDALDAAVARGIDVVIVDTAGRLHTRSNLMEELAKIRRTIDKRLPGAEPEVLFVLDATTGQNGLSQATAFHAATGLTGIILTKLDSTAKGGIVFAIGRALNVPVLFVGVGERVEDLVPFDPAAFLSALFA